MDDSIIIQIDYQSSNTNIQNNNNNNNNNEIFCLFFILIPKWKVNWWLLPVYLITYPIAKPMVIIEKFSDNLLGTQFFDIVNQCDPWKIPTKIIIIKLIKINKNLPNILYLFLKPIQKFLKF